MYVGTLPDTAFRMSIVEFGWKTVVSSNDIAKLPPKSKSTDLIFYLHFPSYQKIAITASLGLLAI